MSEMDVFDVYPRAVNPVLFEEAYLCHKAASETYRVSHPKGAQGQPVATHAASPQQQQRTAVLTIAAQLLVLERNKLLDRFCVDWLRFRDIPIPEKDHAPTGTLGVQGSQGTDGPVRPEDRGDQGGSNTLHDTGSTSRTQPPGGITVP